MKLKSKPSGRTKKRYILIEGRKEDAEKAILDYLGILGYARASPVFMGQKGNKLILAVDRKELDNVKASFALSEKDIKTIRVSGTLKGLQ